MFVNIGYSEAATDVMRTANPSSYTPTRLINLTRCQNPKVVTISTSTYCRMPIITCSIQPVLRSATHQSNEGSIIRRDPAPNESRRVGHEGQLKQWCVVRSEALLWQSFMLTHAINIFRESEAMMPKRVRGLTKT